MTLQTLIENQNILVPAFVEIQMLPGIPQIHFLGLPDKVIKESFFRIKAALKSSGFKFPVSQQVIVNIRPSSLKKSSKGLELAVALGILHLTGQKEIPEKLFDHIFYGELDLNGGVREPDDIIYFKNINNYKILSGKVYKEHTDFSRIYHLREEFIIQELQKVVKTLKRPIFGLEQKYSEDEAELIFLMSVSEMHTLLAGQAGAGKSFLVRNYSSFYKGFLEGEIFEKHNASGDSQWYSVVAPHHSLTPGAFLGGGVSLQQGEIEKVENGILILDEFLEFNPLILESLREPMTGESMRIARAGRVKNIKPDFQVVATTNLCPCGRWVPANEYISCRFSVSKCKGYLNRLSGPLLDRFGLIYFHVLKNMNRDVDGCKILHRIQKFHQRYHQLKNDKNKIDVKDIELFKSLYGDLSGRRRQALLKIAEIYAIESERDSITLSDLQKSEFWTVRGFYQVEQGM